MVKASPLSEVTSAFERGRGTLVSLRLSADWMTPVRAFMHLRDAGPCFLFESVERAVFRGRYSVMGFHSDVMWTYQGNHQGTLRRDGASTSSLTGTGPDQLRWLLAEDPLDMPPDLPPLAMGLYGFLGFDMIRDVEDLPTEKPDTIGLPTAQMFRPSLVLIFDNVRDELILVRIVSPRSGLNALAAHEQALGALHETLKILQNGQGFCVEDEQNDQARAPSSIASNMTQTAFCDAVLKAKEAILAGDCFQIVLSQRFSRPFVGDAFAYYRRLRRLNPSPYLFFLQMDDFYLVGSSPETLVRVEDGQMTVRPIAGTRPRGKTVEEDQALAADLLADPKERSEHLMLLDLGRNDASRVCQAGSVTVKDPFSIERYSHVMHIVSTVCGTLRDDVDVITALLAGFPAGTVSGAPKVRALEIIDALEPHQRRHYGGGVGYISADQKTMDTCIALRTAVIKNGHLYVQAGAGIVEGSDPQSEYTETVNKAGALLAAG